MKLFHVMLLFTFLMAGCGTYEDPIQPTRYQIENIDRNSGDNEDLMFSVDPSIKHDDESINPDIEQKNPPRDQ